MTGDTIFPENPCVLEDASDAFGEPGRAGYYSRWYREPGPEAHFDDPDGLLPKDPPRAQNFNYKLANVERATGLRIYARVFANFVPTPQAPNPEAFAGGLASSLGLQDAGVLAVYFAATGKWVLSVGNSMVGPFTRLPGNPQKLPSYEPLEGAIGRFLADSTNGSTNMQRLLRRL